MWAFIVRRLLYNIPVYLGIIFLTMALLRVRDPVSGYLGKHASPEQIEALRSDMGLNRPLFIDVGVWRRPWDAEQGGAGGTYLRKKVSNVGGYTATWKAELQAGAYRVMMSWPNVPDAADSVTVKIKDGVVGKGDVEIDQRIGEPTGDAEAGGAPPPDPEPFGWHELGTFTLESGTGVVELTNLSTGSGYALAGSVRFEPEDVGAPTTVSVGDEGFTSGGREWTPGRFAHSFVDNQYFSFLAEVFTLDFSTESWAQPGRTVGGMIVSSIPPTMSIATPDIAASAVIAIVIALISAYYRGRAADRILVVLAVLGMSISYLVYIIFGQYFGAYIPRTFIHDFDLIAIKGYEPWTTWGHVSLLGLSIPFPTGVNLMTWVHYCLLPTTIGVVVAMGYNTRFYRAVMVEETGRDYIVTAMAKGAGKRKIMFVHMLKNAMIPIITRIMATLPFLITGEILMEWFFNIPGMGRTLIEGIFANDFPVIQACVAVIAALFILSIILTDVLYALVDPRVRLS